MALPRRKLTIAISLAAIIVVTVVFWYFSFRPQPFDPILWQDKARVENGIRLEMADQLVAQKRLHKLTRSEVVELLGEPPVTKYFTDWDLVYWLGPERGFMSIDSEWLVVRLDKSGRVCDYRIVRD